MCFERFLATPRPPEARASFVPIVHHDVQHARASIWSKSSSNGSRELSECACGAEAARVGSRRGQTYLHAVRVGLSSPQYNKSTAATGSLVVVRGARTTAHLSKHGSLSIPTILRPQTTLSRHFSFVHMPYHQVGDLWLLLIRALLTAVLVDSFMVKVPGAPLGSTRRALFLALGWHAAVR